MKKGKTGLLLALLGGALALAGLPPAIAQNGGPGHQRGVPDVNLGVGGVQGAKAGVFVPAVPPATSGAAGLPPSGGMLPPGYRDAPGLRLGPGHSVGTPLGVPATPGVRPPHSATGLLQPAEGVARGNGKGASGFGAAASPEAEIAPPVASAPDGFVSENSGGSESLPRQIPVCH